MQSRLSHCLGETLCSRGPWSADSPYLWSSNSRTGIKVSDPTSCQCARGRRWPLLCLSCHHLSERPTGGFWLLPVACSCSGLHRHPGNESVHGRALCVFVSAAFSDHSAFQINKTSKSKASVFQYITARLVQLLYDFYMRQKRTTQHISTMYIFIKSMLKMTAFSIFLEI